MNRKSSENMKISSFNANLDLFQIMQNSSEQDKTKQKQNNHVPKGKKSIVKKDIPKIEFDEVYAPENIDDSSCSTFNKMNLRATPRSQYSKRNCVITPNYTLQKRKIISPSYSSSSSSSSISPSTSNCNSISSNFSPSNYNNTLNNLPAYSSCNYNSSSSSLPSPYSSPEFIPDKKITKSLEKKIGDKSHIIQKEEFVKPSEKNKRKLRTTLQSSELKIINEDNSSLINHHNEHYQSKGNQMNNQKDGNDDNNLDLESIRNKFTFHGCKKQKKTNDVSLEIESCSSQEFNYYSVLFPCDVLPSKYNYLREYIGKKFIDSEAPLKDPFKKGKVMDIVQLDGKGPYLFKFYNYYRQRKQAPNPENKDLWAYQGCDELIKEENKQLYVWQS